MRAGGGLTSRMVPAGNASARAFARRLRPIVDPWLRMEGRHAYRVVDPAGIAGGGVLRPRLAPSLSTGGDRRSDERLPPAMVSALYRRVRAPGGGWADA